MLRKAKLHILLVAAMSLLASAAWAHSPALPDSIKTPAAPKPCVALSHLDVGITAGTTGLGIEVGTPLTPWLNVRAGFSWMPHFNIPMTFGLETFDLDGANTNKFKDLQAMMSEQLGIEMDDRIDMNAKARMFDFKLLFDFYPIPDNKHWSVTAGFYWGNSHVGHIENDVLDAPTLVGVTIYNTMYDYFTSNKWFYEPIFGEIYIDPEIGAEMKEKFERYGRLGVHLGNFKSDGKPYIMEPDENCMVKANMYVNHFKPYLGAGYETRFGSGDRWKFATNLGVLFWGGTPDIKTHANLNMDNNPTVNLSKDVEDIHGKVGDYVKVVKALKVYPALTFSLSYTIF